MDSDPSWILVLEARGDGLYPTTLFHHCIAHLICCVINLLTWELDVILFVYFTRIVLVYIDNIDAEMRLFCMQVKIFRKFPSSTSYSAKPIERMSIVLTPTSVIFFMQRLVKMSFITVNQIQWIVSIWNRSEIVPFGSLLDFIYHFILYFHFEDLCYTLNSKNIVDTRYAYDIRFWITSLLYLVIFYIWPDAILGVSYVVKFSSTHHPR